MQSHETVLANHQGQLSGFAAAIAAVQSSLASWKAAAIGVAGAIFAVMALLGTFQFNTSQTIDRVDGKVVDLSDQFDDLSVEIRTLPAAINEQISNLAAEFATVSQRQPIVIQPQPMPPQQPDLELAPQ